KFSDGTAFDAAAAKMNLDRAAKSPGSQPYVGNVDTVDATDAQTLVIKTKTPYAQTIFNLGAFQLSMVAASALQKGPEFLATNGCGSGPFVSRAWPSGDLSPRERNTPPWRAAPKLDRVLMRTAQDDNPRMAALQWGALALMTTPPAPAVKQLGTDA